MKTHPLLVGFLILTLLLVGLFSFGSHKKSDFSPFAQIKDKKISLMVAQTPHQRELGLSVRENLGENEGMLFVFDEPSAYTFWMKDMKFPIDIIWLDENSKIIHIVSAVAPESYPTMFTPPEKALYVLETKAHFVEVNTLKIGDVVELNLNK